MTAPSRRTPEEIEHLKRNWLHDGCWDIEDTEGFEAHHDELLAWKEQVLAEQAAESQRDLEAQARRNSLPVDVQAAVNRLQARHDQSMEDAQRLLQHYVGRGLEWDCRQELASVLEKTADAARALVIRDLLKMGIVGPEVLQ